MIILRQREYSDAQTKALYGIEKLKNSAKKWSAGVRRDFWSGVEPKSSKSLTKLAIANQEVRGKSKVQMMREAVKKRQALREKVTGIKYAAANPSEAIPEVVERGATKFGEAPVGVGLTAAGYIPSAYGYYIPGTTAMAMGAEKVASKVPVYRKYKNWYAKKPSHPVPKFLGNASGTILNYAKNLA